MQIVINVRKSTKSHLATLKKIIESSEEIVICSGWMKMCGLSELLPTMDIALTRGASIRVYTNREHTESGCIEALAARKQIIHANVPKPTYLHTKLYYGRQGSSYIAMIGSANVTAGGLWKNEELSQVVNGVVDDPLHSQLAPYLKTLSGLMVV